MTGELKAWLSKVLGVVDDSTSIHAPIAFPKHARAREAVKEAILAISKEEKFPVPGMPPDKRNKKINDWLVKHNRVSVSGMTINRAIKELRGPPTKLVKK